MRASAGTDPPQQQQKQLAAELTAQHEKKRRLLVGVSRFNEKPRKGLVRAQSM